MSAESRPFFIRHQSTAPRFAALFLWLSLLLCGAARAEAALERLEFLTAGGPQIFQVEVARTLAQLSQGLMFRRSMPEDQGMLFDFGVEKTVLMWMKNTYIPLDMVFVSRQGRVVSIARDAVPMSEAVISSGRPAFAAIELNAGMAQKIGLAVGDQVRHPLFKR